jgi:hypothetical protein
MALPAPKILHCDYCEQDTEHETGNLPTAAITYWACIVCGEVRAEED